MHKRLGLTLFAGLAIFVAACSGGGATTAPSARPVGRTVRRAAPSAAPSVEASVEPSATAGITCDSKINVGLVTDVGRINDKGFNQSAYEGMLAAAEAAPELLRHRVHRDHQPVRLRGQHRAVHRQRL